MKKLFLILIALCGVVSATVRTWNGTDFGGLIATTDTIKWDGTSVVDWTATSNIECAHAVVASTYSGNWSDATWWLTINNGGLIIDGTGNRTLGAQLTFNGNGLFHIGSTVGTTASTNCIVTFNGSYDTTDIDKEIVLKKINVNNNLYNRGSAAFVLAGGASVPIVMAANSTLTGAGGITTRFAASGLVIDKQESSTFNPSGNFFISPFHTSGEITLTIPEINAPFCAINTGLLAAGTCIFEITGNITATSLRSVTGRSTINTNNNTIKMSNIALGSNAAGSKSYFNVGSSKIIATSMNTAQYATDSTIITSNGAVFSINYEWTHGTVERIDGAYTIAPVNHLFMGHSMFSSLNSYSPEWFFEESYGLADFKNRSIGGSVIANTESRIDSNLTAYNPARVYIWIGQNDFTDYTEATFATAMANYFVTWKSLIGKIKTFGVDSIYIAEMSPYGTVAVPMTPEKLTAYRLFNAALKDSCESNDLFWIPTFDSLLEPGYTNVLKLSTTADGLHPNGTVAGAQYCGYLFSLADKIAGPSVPAVCTVSPASQTVTSAQSATFTSTFTGTGTLTYQWQTKNWDIWENISGATSNTYLVTQNYFHNGLQFRVIGIGDNIGDTSNVATLTVTIAPVAPSITAQPQAQTVTLGNSVTFSVTATGTSLTYQWIRRVIVNGNNIDVVVNGETSSSYSFTPTYNDSGISYLVVVSGSVLPSATSNAVLLTVHNVISNDPSITSVIPFYVRPSRIITITGTKLGTSGALLINGVSFGTPISRTENEIVVTIPSTASFGINTITVNNGFSSTTATCKVLNSWIKILFPNGRN